MGLDTGGKLERHCDLISPSRHYPPVIERYLLVFFIDFFTPSL